MNYFSKRSKLQILLVLILGISIVGLTGCGTDTQGQVDGKPTIVFGDAGWDSFTFHNEVAKFIVEQGYGYKTDVTMGSTATTFTGLRQGDIDVYMETWTTNLGDTYQEALDAGDVLEIATNYSDSAQGLYVPTYVIKGDPDRGIEPVAPELKSVQDLPKHWEAFKDEEEPTKGRVYGAIPGWKVDEITRIKLETYGIDKTYNYFSPGSEAALASSIAAAYEKGEPWVGYYWEPTWVMGKYDMTLLEDTPYSEEKWNNGYACEMPSVDVTVLVNKNMTEKAPDLVEFLKNYKTSSKVTSEALAYMQQNEVGADEAAKWFLQEHEDLWTKWVTDDVAGKVKEALQ
jgi:glycine betaine/proline transport system substrate-binding protein